MTGALGATWDSAGACLLLCLSFPLLKGAGHVGLEPQSPPYFPWIPGSPLGVGHLRFIDRSPLVSVGTWASATLGSGLGRAGGDRLAPQPICLTGGFPPSSRSELSCSKNEKELEELLLEASQESGQETL